ncbi:MAG: hypothetical protein IT196_17295 [Acidimicrobiales bacterium]|nr:hypothetical protein [Acidimicrobiales bacterium]
MAAQLLLILGVDGAGKNHVANVGAAALAAAGHRVVTRSGYLSARDRPVTSSEDKGRLRLTEERLFLFAFPLLRPVIPFVVDALLRADLRRWNRRPAASGRTVVVSHTPIRVLAFTLGHRRADQPLQVPRRVGRTLHRVARDTGLRAVVLDVSPSVRAQRLSERAMRGRLDRFDRYLANPANAALAERIEATLVELAERYLDASVLYNDDLDDDAIAEGLGVGRVRMLPTAPVT